MAVADNEVAVPEFLQRGHPAEADVGAGDFVLDLPNDFFIGRNFDHAVAAAGGDQRVAVLQADRAVAAGVNEVLPNDLALAVVLGDNARVLGGDEVVALRREAHPAGVLATVFFHRYLVDNFALFIDLDDAAHPTFDDGGVAVFQPREGVHVHPLALVAVHRGGVVSPDDFFAERHLGELGPTVMVKNVAVGQEVHVVVAGVALLRAGGLVRPKHVAVAVGDCDDVFAVGCADQNQALCPANDSGEQQREHKEETEIGFHAGEINRLAKRRRARVRSAEEAGLEAVAVFAQA